MFHSWFLFPQHFVWLLERVNIAFFAERTWMSTLSSKAIWARCRGFHRAIFAPSCAETLRLDESSKSMARGWVAQWTCAVPCSGSHTAIFVVSYTETSPQTKSSKSLVLGRHGAEIRVLHETLHSHVRSFMYWHVTCGWILEIAGINQTRKQFLHRTEAFHAAIFASAFIRTVLLTNGFQAKCLRSTLRALPPHLSRISNASVLQKAACSTCSTLLLQRQVDHLGKVMRADEANPIRTSCLVADTSLPITSLYIRNVGSPKKDWLGTVRQNAGA